MVYIGELAALLTSISFSLTSTMFTLAGRRVGSVIVNRTRLVLAVVFLTLTHWIVLGNPLPDFSEPNRWLWLGLSGIAGLVLGDAFLFQAFIWIGPRLSMLMMSLVPVIATILAWIFLGENLTWKQIFGPFIGVSFSLFSIQHAEIGVASTLMALPPIFLLPISYLVFKERYGWGVVFGTFIALTGVTLLFML